MATHYAAQPELSTRPLFAVGNQGPTAKLPPYRPGCRLKVDFGPAGQAAAERFYESLPKLVLAECHPDTEKSNPERGYLVECWCNNETASAAKRGARFYQAMQALSDSLLAVALDEPAETPAPAAPPRQAWAEQLMQHPPRQISKPAASSIGTGQLFD